jgi:hypothetical protein
LTVTAKHVAAARRYPDTRGKDRHDSERPKDPGNKVPEKDSK